MNLDPRFFHSPARDSQPQELADLPTHPIPLNEPERPGPQALRPASCEALRAALHELPDATDAAPHLGQALLNAGLIDLPTLQRALALQARPGPHRALGRILVDIGALSELRLRMALAEWQGVRVVDPHALVPGADVLAAVPRALAERDGVLPLLVEGDTLVVLVADPWDHALLDHLRFATQRRIRPLMALPGSLMPAIHRAYAAAQAQPGGAGLARASLQDLAAQLRSSPETTLPVEAEMVSESDNTLVRLVNSLIEEAVRRNASDIHIETADEPRQVRVRMRIDGELVPVLELQARLRFAVVARIKIMADLDISEHRKPQDGKIDFARFGGPSVELRVVTVPTSRGLEDVVLRLLGSRRPMALEQIGLAEDNLNALRSVIAKPYGLILICGPTGCGKTTTLHSVLRDINTDGRKIWTAEDPVEITQDGLRQVQVNPRIGWTFAAAMRTFLRADPDVIMIGEMRDEETARIAVEASLTGHLVLSTLHTNSAPESIARLLEIGLDPYNFSDSLLAILAQRLVRTLCSHCRESEIAGEDELDALAAQYLGSGSAARTDAAHAALRTRWRAQHGDARGRIRLQRRRGCDHCGGTGYHGRMGLHELLLADDAVRRLVRHRDDAGALQAAALAGGMKTLRQDGITKVLAGLTDLPEVLAASNT
jgi:type II secretory ATPase GspE/PulE/Tfp pilus assembly ATPase PilB-like protein